VNLKSWWSWKILHSSCGLLSAEEPKYSCIVVVHNQVQRSITIMVQMLRVRFSRELHKKIFTDAPSTNEIKNLNKKIAKQEDNYESYYSNFRKQRFVQS
jgi:cell division protein FtsI (penicillin-binding protein 3)